MSICTSLIGRHSVVSIDASIGELLKQDGAKAYLGTMGDSGFEWGVGRAGSYEGHLHRCLVDVLYAPGGMRIGVAGAHIVECKLFIASAELFFDPFDISDFWFMKFLGCPRTAHDTVPDKSLNRAPDRGSGARWIAIDRGVVGYAFYDWRTNFRSEVAHELIEGSRGGLRVSSAGWSMRIRE